MEIRDYPSAIERFRAAGAEVDGSRVRFPRGLCRSIVTATAPAVYTQHGRNPERNVQIGGDATVFATSTWCTPTCATATNRSWVR